MAKESTYVPVITPVDGDYFRMVDNPGGTPLTANASGTGVKAWLKTYFDTLFYGLANVSFVTSDFSKTSDTTLADVTGLTFTTVNGGKYRFKAMLLLSCHASGGAKVAVSGTNTATKINYLVQLFTTTALASEANTALDGDYGSTAAHVKCLIEGYIEVNAGGTLTVQFAQNASYGTASKVLEGSWFEVDKVG